MGTTYNDIKDLLKAIAICKDGQTKAMLYDRLNQVMESSGGASIAIDIVLGRASIQELFGLAKGAGLKFVSRVSKGSTAQIPRFEFIHLATTPPPVYIYTPEPKSDMLVDTLLANLQGRML